MIQKNINDVVSLVVPKSHSHIHKNVEVTIVLLLKGAVSAYGVTNMKRLSIVYPTNRSMTSFQEQPPFFVSMERANIYILHCVHKEKVEPWMKCKRKSDRHPKRVTKYKRMRKSDNPSISIEMKLKNMGKKTMMHGEMSNTKAIKSLKY